MVAAGELCCLLVNTEIFLGIQEDLHQENDYFYQGLENPTKH